MVNIKYILFTDVKKYILEKQKAHNEANKEKLSDKQKKYYNNNKEKFAEKSKIYREENKETIKKLKQEYHQKNKEIISQKKKNDSKTFDGFFTRMILKSKYTDKLKNFEQICDVDIDYIKEMLKTQNNKCYFCNHDLVYECTSNKLNQASIDRIDSNKPHIKTNISITCIFCNHAKNINNNETYFEFIKSLKTGKVNKPNNDDPNGKMKLYLLNLQHSCRTSDKRKFKDIDTSTIITKEQIKQLIEKQNNKCAISGLPLIPSSINMFPYKPSVDRLDNTKPHTLDNCQIVCLAVQFGKLTYDNQYVINYLNEIKNNVSNEIEV